MLSQYGPALLAQYENALALSQRLVGKWFPQYMFAGDPAKRGTAGGIAEELANHARYLSHGRHVSSQDAVALTLGVEELEADQVP